MYFIEIDDDLITCKGQGDFKTSGQIEVTESIYSDLTSLPATYVMEGGGIISVSPLPQQRNLAPAQEREQAYESLRYREDESPLIEWEDRPITVDQAVKKYQEYFAEGSRKAKQLQRLIAGAKQHIRNIYPD